MKIFQGLGNNKRIISTIKFNQQIVFERASDNNDHTLFRSETLNVGIYGDSTCIIAPKAAITMTFTGNFRPDYEGRYKGELLLIDGLGGMEIYPQRYEADYKVKQFELGKKNWTADYQLSAGQRMMIAAFPGKPFDWEESFKTRILITHGSDGTDSKNIYGQMPPDITIQQWSKNFNILVVFLKGLYARPKGNINALWSDSPYIIENKPEFQRLVETAHNNNMKVAVYTAFSSYYHDFKKTEPFIEQIEKLRDKYHIDGVYIDGLSNDYDFTYHDDNKILNWEIVRRIRQLFGAEGVAILHGTHIIKPYKANPVAAAPNIDSYCTATLNGEGVPFDSTEDPYIRYEVRKYGISNTIGMWRPSGTHPASITYKEIADAVIKMNCRQESHSWMIMQNDKYRWSSGLADQYLYYLDKLETLKNRKDL